MSTTNIAVYASPAKEVCGIWVLVCLFQMLRFTANFDPDFILAENGDGFRNQTCMISSSEFFHYDLLDDPTGVTYEGPSCGTCLWCFYRVGSALYLLRYTSCRS